MALPQSISEIEMNYLLDEWNLYMLESENELNETHAHEGWVDKYWADVLGKKNVNGEMKYKVLSKVVKSALTLAHRNAVCEKSLSANKRTLTH